MTNTMIERVERAVCIALGHEPETYACDRHVKAMCSRVARAAIKAMREPTPRMIEAFDIIHNRAYHSSSKYRCAHSVSAMIDAVLSEGERS